MARRRNKGQERATARARIETLTALARERALARDPLAERYTHLARRIAMRYQLPMRRLHVCSCGTYRVPGRNSRTRIQRHRVVTTCLACGAVRRRPLGERT